MKRNLTAAAKGGDAQGPVIEMKMHQALLL
jgi:hypothetical protein